MGTKGAKCDKGQCLLLRGGGAKVDHKLLSRCDSKPESFLHFCFGFNDEFFFSDFYHQCNTVMGISPFLNTLFVNLLYHQYNTVIGISPF